MKKVSIERLRSDLAERDSAEYEKRAAERQAYADKEGSRLSCHSTGVAAIWGMAFLDAQVDGMPGKIDLASPNGHLKGFSVTRADDGWRVQCDDHAALAGYVGGIGMARSSSYADRAMKAMDIDHSPESYKEIAGMMSWKPGLLRAAAAHVSSETVAATVSLGKDSIITLGGRGFDDEFHDELLEVALAKPDALNLPIGAGMPPLMRLAGSGSVPFTKWAIASGLLLPNVSLDGATAATIAVDAGRADMLKALHEAGEKLDVVSKAGWTLLHFAVEQAGLGDDDSIEIARWLVERGWTPMPRTRMA